MDSCILPAVADGFVYLGSNDFKLYVSTGTTIWSRGLGAEVRSPAVADGYVYVTTYDYKNISNVWALGEPAL